MSHSSPSGPTLPLAVPPTTAFRLDIQGLRALAVVVVVLFHAGLPLPGGFVGVDMFFVVSGFVITAMLKREWEATGRIRLTSFYIRRFMRLTPALAVVVVFAVLASSLILSPLGAQQAIGATGIGAMLLSANFVIAETTGGYFDVAADLNPLLNLWSLSVEEQFYLVFPALLIAAWAVARRFGRVRWVAAAAILTLGIVSFALAQIDSTGAELRFVPDFLFGFYGPGGRVWEFAVGALIALLASRIVIRARRVAAVMGSAGLALIAASLLLINEATPFPGVWTLLPVAGTALLIVAGTSDGNAVSRLLAARPMQWMGDRSYSFYLWHWPLISLSIALWPGEPVAKVVAAALSLVPAALSYRFVETRWRRFRPQSRAAFVRVVAVVLLPALLLPAMLWTAAVNGFWNPAVQSFQAANQHHLLTLENCDHGMPVSALESGSCVFNAEASGTPVYLVGDSNAGHFIEGILDASVDLGSPVVASTTNACPFIDGYVGVPGPNGGVVVDECEVFRLGMIDFLEDAPPGIVVISQIASYWSNPDTVIGADEATATSATDEKLAFFAERFPAVVAGIRAAGHEVLLVQQVPQFLPYDPQACSLFEVGSAQCAESMPRAEAEGQSTEVQAIIADAAAQTGSMTLQLRDDLCGPKTCSTTVDGVVNYRDAVHISVTASHATAPRFESALRELISRR